MLGAIKQPYGGYINKKIFDIIQLEDSAILKENENINAGLVGTTVDYLTRYFSGTKKEDAFAISLKGAYCLDFFTKKSAALKKAVRLLRKIKRLNKKAIIAACKLSGFDVCLRAGIMRYKPVDEINPDSDTINNIACMVNRSLSFLKEHGPVVLDGFTFEGGYTNIISSGDGDYLTKDTLWDFKTSRSEPTSKHTLQLLVYYIMGVHSIHKEFMSIKKLGIYNPRLNKVYIVKIEDIPESVINAVSKEVIGYK